MTINEAEKAVDSLCGWEEARTSASLREELGRGVSRDREIWIVSELSRRVTLNMLQVDKYIGVSKSAKNFGVRSVM